VPPRRGREASEHQLHLLQRRRRLCLPVPAQWNDAPCRGPRLATPHLVSTHNRRARRDVPRRSTGHRPPPRRHRRTTRARIRIAPCRGPSGAVTICTPRRGLLVSNRTGTRIAFPTARARRRAPSQMPRRIASVRTAWSASRRAANGRPRDPEWIVRGRRQRPRRLAWTRAVTITAGAHGGCACN
jgi:hypothetical protein